MGSWVAWVLLISNAIVVAILTVTALPWFSGDHLEGATLKLHMLASGVLVIALPVLALWLLAQVIGGSGASRLQQIGYWLFVSSGLVAIATMFACMLPYLSTEQMHELIDVHGYAGFVTVPAVVLLLVGTARSRRIQATRSATPG